MMTVTYNGLSVDITWRDLRAYLNTSTLPWFRTQKEILVVGYRKDINLTLNNNRGKKK